MNKKLRNRIIYITTAILWLVAGYRTWKNYQAGEELEEFENYTTHSFSPVAFNKDTFELDLPDSDPFLRSQSRGYQRENHSDPITNTHTKPKEIKKDPPPAPKPWPNIEYFGFVKNRSGETPLCLLKINGRNVQLAKGKEEFGVLVSDVWRDSVGVVFEGEMKIFRR